MDWLLAIHNFGRLLAGWLLVAIDENMVQLANGCICCTINRSLVDAVFAIANRAESVDYLVIETAGIADPLPIVRSLTTTDLQQVTRVDSVLTVVDAESFTSEHYSSEAALNQLIFGDIMLLNKTDLVTPEVVTELENYIRSIEGRGFCDRSVGKYRYLCYSILIFQIQTSSIGL